MRINAWQNILLLALVMLVVGADQALAWGPATHTHLALDLLQQVGMLPAAVAALLTRHASSFLFGNIAADMVFAKRLSRVKQFCHHWSTGFRLLESADNEARQAFAYGYLCHLASDTVAHGKFVPRQLSLTGTTMNLGHVYWELRADQLLDRATWAALERVLADDHDQHHEVMRDHLRWSCLPYSVNRRLFHRMNNLVVRPNWGTSMRLASAMSRWDLCPELFCAYRDEAVGRMISIVKDSHRSALLAEDPNGNAALREACLHRRETRRLRRRGMPTMALHREVAASLAPQPPLPAEPDGDPAPLITIAH